MYLPATHQTQKQSEEGKSHTRPSVTDETTQQSQHNDDTILLLLWYARDEAGRI